MDRRNFIAMGATATFGLPLPQMHAQEAARKPMAPSPNVLFVFSDTHRWCSMSFTETPKAQTPNLAAMAERGVSFSNCYSTLPICSPYRAILMTGRWPWQQGFIANHMSLEDRPDAATSKGATMGWLFRDAGYATHYVGKWHLGDPARSVDYGFDTACTWGNEDHSAMEYSAHGAGNPFGKGRGLDWHKDARYTGIKGDQSFPYKIVGETDQALILLEQHRKATPDKPLFLMLSLQDPHGPFRKKGKPTYPPHIEAACRKLGDPEYRKNDGKRNGKWVHDYHVSVTAVDEQIGRIRSRLEELGMAENTILVYTSDHGGMGGAQGVPGGQKRWPHDESSRVPFLVEWPDGIPAAKRDRAVTALFSSIDILPTVCGLAGLAPKLTGTSGKYLADSPGVNHAANVTGAPDAPTPRSILVCHPSNMNNKSPACPVHRTVITHKYMYSVKGKTRLGNREKWRKWAPDREQEWCLYDRQADPLQMVNLIADPALADVRTEMREELAGWLAKAETPFVRTWFQKHPHAKRWQKEHEGRGIEDAFDLARCLPAK
ncbi:MAG: sulfatase-like hydrolase/transferase [Victivallales bacterium]|nr:sulfatase-like hydrolase/transferase [Victivallales bacterium]